MSVSIISGTPKLLFKKEVYRGRVQYWIPFVLSIPLTLPKLPPSPPYACYYRSDQKTIYISDYVGRIYKITPEDPVVVTTSLYLRKAVEQSIQFKKGKFYRFCSGSMSFTGNYAPSDPSIYECDMSGNCTSVASMPSAVTFTLTLTMPSDNYPKIGILFGQLGPNLPYLLFRHIGGSRTTNTFVIFDTNTYSLEIASLEPSWGVLLIDYDSVVIKNQKKAYVMLFKTDVTGTKHFMEVKYVDLTTFGYGDVTSFDLSELIPDVLFVENNTDPVIKFSAVTVSNKDFIVGLYRSKTGEVKQIVFDTNMEVVNDVKIPTSNLYIYDNPEAPALIPLMTPVYDYSIDQEDNIPLMSLMDVRSDSQVYSLYNYVGTLYQPEEGSTELVVVIPKSGVSSDKPMYNYFTSSYMYEPSITLVSKNRPVVALGDFDIYAARIA